MMRRLLRRSLVALIWAGFAWLLWRTWLSINQVAARPPAVEAMAAWSVGVGVIIAVILAVALVATAYLLEK